MMTEDLGPKVLQWKDMIIKSILHLRYETGNQIE